MRRHTGQATAAAGLAFVSFLAWRLMSSCDSRLSSKACVPLWGASLQGLPSAAKMLPAFNRGVTGAQGVLEGVLVALCLATLPASAVSQFGTDLFWKTAVLHSHHVASPSDLGLHDQDLNTWHAMVRHRQTDR